MAEATNILRGPPFVPQREYQSVGHYLYEIMTAYDTADFMEDPETNTLLNYKQTLEDSIKCAIALQKQHLSINDRIAVLSPNTTNYGILILGSLFSGVTLCLLDKNYRDGNLFTALKDCQPKIIFITPSDLTTVTNIKPYIFWGMRVMYLPSYGPDGLQGLISMISPTELENFKLPKIDPENHVPLIAFTSGVSREPGKAVMLTDKNILMTIECQKNDPEGVINNDSVVLGIYPMHYLISYFNFLFTIAFKAKIIIWATNDMEKLVLAIQNKKITTLTLSPPVAYALNKFLFNIYLNLKEEVLDSTKSIIIPEMKFTQSLNNKLLSYFNIPSIRTNYGMAELCSSVLSYSGEYVPKCVGILRPGVEAKIIPLGSQSKEPLGPYYRGEMCFKTETIVKGYIIENQFYNVKIDEDGFLCTGDIGYYDEDKYFFFLERKEDLIKHRNLNSLSGAMLEDILLNNNAVKDCAIIARPNPNVAEYPRAYVVKRDNNESITARNLIKYVYDHGNRCDTYSITGGICFIDKIPRSETGKVLRRLLKLRKYY